MFDSPPIKVPQNSIPTCNNEKEIPVKMFVSENKNHRDVKQEEMLEIKIPYINHNLIPLRRPIPLLFVESNTTPHLPERIKSPISVNFGSGIIFSNIEYKSKIEECGINHNINRPSPDQNDGLSIANSIPMAHDLSQKNFIKRNTIANHPSLVMDFFIKVDQQKLLKVQIIFVKFLLPHILATIFSFVYIYIHTYIDKLCWMREICDCDNNIWLKIYTLCRNIFNYWNLIFLLGYYSLFVIKEIKNIYFLKGISFFGFYGSMIVIYLISDGSEEETSSLFTYGIGFFLASLSYLTIFYKLKFNCYLMKEKILFQTLLWFILFFHLIAKRFVFALVKSSLQNELGTLGRNLGQIIISFYSFMYKIVFKYLILRFSLRILKEKGEYNAIIFFMRLIVCFIISINTSNIYSMDIKDWGGWFLIATYCIFLFEFYTRINPYSKLYYWLKWKVFNMKMEQSQANLDYEQILSIKKVLSGYLLDFQFIYIPRLFILYYYNHLISFHSGDFSVDCKLNLSEKFPRNPFMLLVIIILNISMPIIFFLWMHKKKKIIFEFRFENYNFIERTYVIFLFHTYFEFIFQDFLATI